MAACRDTSNFPYRMTTLCYFYQFTIFRVMTIPDYIADSKQTAAFRCWISLFFITKVIKDIKHHRKAVHVTGFGGLVFLSNEVHRNDFVSSFSVIALPNHFQLSQSPVSCLSFHSLQWRQPITLSTVLWTCVNLTPLCHWEGLCRC